MDFRIVSKKPDAPRSWLAALAAGREGARRVLASPVFASIAARFAALAEAGTQGYPLDAKRRLKILNVMAYLIAIASFAFALQQASADISMNAPAVVINLALCAMALCVPLAHRLNDIAGGLLIVGAEWVALFGLSAFFGRDGGAQLHYIVGAAAPFVVFGLKRIWLVLAIVVSGLALHVTAWFAFPPEHAMITPGPGVLDPIYTQAAITTVSLIAASVYYAFSLAERAKAETEALLRNILPASIVERLQANPALGIADSFEDASVLFSDISGFVPLARRLGPSRTVELLNEIVSEFDRLATRHGVEKIKTIGDAYMVASGVPDPTPDHARRLAAMGLDMLAAIDRLRVERGIDIRIRIGLASGPVMAGVIGTKKFSYDVWGDAVNLAARLETLGQTGRVHVCPACRARLGEAFRFESRGTIEIKGVGRQETWLIAAPSGFAEP